MRTTLPDGWLESQMKKYYYTQRSLAKEIKVSKTTIGRLLRDNGPCSGRIAWALVITFKQREKEREGWRKHGK